MLFCWIMLALLVEPRIDSVLVLGGYRQIYKQPRGSIQGVVFLPTGDALANANITLVPHGVPAAQTHTTVSSKVGRFAFSSLPAGLYEVVVDFKDAWLVTSNSKQVAVRASRTASVEIRLAYIEQCHSGTVSNDDLVDEDKKDILQWLAKNVVMEDFTGAERSQSEETIILSQNLQPDWLVGSSIPRPFVLSASEIQRRANREGDYMYWIFGTISKHGGCMAVTVEKVWADGTSTLESGQRILHGEKTMNYIFHKRGGKWIGTFISGAIT